MLGVLLPWHSPAGASQHEAAQQLAECVASLIQRGQQAHASLCVGVPDGDALQGGEAALKRALPAGLKWHLTVFPRQEFGTWKAAGFHHSDSIAERRSPRKQRLAGTPLEAVASAAVGTPTEGAASSEAGPRPWGWVWGRLASAAASALQVDAFVLLEPGLELTPRNWPELVAGELAARPEATCVLLTDASCPGAASFPALRRRHLALCSGLGAAALGSAGVAPAACDEHGAGTFVAELYRAVRGGVVSLAGVVVAQGSASGSLSVALSGRSRGAPPLCTLKPMLDEWRRAAAASQGPQGGMGPAAAPQLTVDVLIPSYRVDPVRLAKILAAPCTEPAVSVRYHLQLDNPSPPPAVLKWLHERQCQMLHRLAMATNAENLGAGGTRSALLDSSAADYVIFFDDDVEPVPGCIDAYVRAFRANPHALAFNGPSYLPHSSEQLPAAVHMTDISGNWEAPAACATVPWGVTANIAFKHTPLRFKTVFPKTGGGEDVDFCVRLGACVICVPKAVVHHPWWDGGRRHLYAHLFRWSLGDTYLMSLMPQFTYYRPPAAAEFVFLLLLAACVRLVTVPHALLATLAVFAVDCATDVFRNCCLQSRLVAHPETSGLRRVTAAAESSVVEFFTEAGRLWGNLERGMVWNVCRRFDWKCGQMPERIEGERLRSGLRCVAFLAATRAAAAALAWMS